MKQSLFRIASAAIAAAVVCCLAVSMTSSARADDFQRVSNRNDLFYNYYAGPNGYMGVPAQMYTSPIASPPIVGHTYITYPALMPHEFLYRHSRHYYRHNPGGGWSHTTVTYR